MSISGPITLRLVSVRRVGPAVAILSFEAEDEFTYRAGQWIAIDIGAGREGGSGDVTLRPFSLASTPAERPRLEVCARLRPGGQTASWIERLRPGDRVEAETPRGKLRLDAEPSEPLLFAATSVAIAPMRALIVEAERAGLLRRRVRLFHGVVLEGVLPYQGEMERIAGRSSGFEFDMRLLDRSVLEAGRPRPEFEVLEDLEGRRETWRPIEEAALSWVESLGEHRSRLRVFLAGHGVFVNALRTSLSERHGVPRDRVRQEIFWS